MLDVRFRLDFEVFDRTDPRIASMRDGLSDRRKTSATWQNNVRDFPAQRPLSRGQFCVSVAVCGRGQPAGALGTSGDRREFHRETTRAL